MAISTGRQMRKQRNEFTGGMNQDVTPALIPQNQFLEAVNLRIIQIDSEDVEFETGTVGLGRSLKKSNIPSMSLALQFPAIPSYTNRLSAGFRGEVTGITSTAVRLTGGVFGAGATYTSVLSDLNAAYTDIGNQIVAATSGALSFIVISIAQPLSTEFSETLQLTPIAPAAGGITYGFVDASCTITAGVGGGAMTLVVDTAPAATNVTPIGWDASSQELIILTTSELNATPSDTPHYGQLWLVNIGNYDQSLPIPLTIAGNLLYNDRLNFSLDNRAQVIYSVENECIKRVYWVENYNPPRSLQVPFPFAQSTLSPGQLEFNPVFGIAGISLLSQGAGQLPVGKYAYAYRLYTSDGKPTLFTPISNTINVTRSNSRYGNTQGGFVGENSSRSNNLSITGVDTSYAEIELVALFYNTEESPPQEIYTVARQGVTGATILFTHSQQSLVIETFSYEQIVVPTATITRAKNILVADNRLLLSNYCETNVNGRFDNTGVTIGSVAQFFVIDDVVATPILENTDWINQTPISDSKSAVQETRQTGYFRNETYRFGIIFYFKNGNAGFVDWLGDYTFPRIDQEPLVSLSGTVVSARALGASIGNIDLNQVDIDGIPFFEKVQGFKIVRANRTALNSQFVARGSFLPTPISFDDAGARIPLNATQEAMRATGSFSTEYIAFYSPDTDLNVASIAAGMTFRYVGKHSQSNSTVPATIPAFFDKNYISEYVDPSAAQTRTIVRASLIEQNGIFENFYQDGKRFLNNIYPFSAGLSQPCGRCWIIELDSAITAGPSLSDTDNTIAYGEILNTAIPPYGGTNEFQLAATEYIDTGHYQPVDPNAATQVYTVTVFGGDCRIAPHVRLFKTARNTAGIQPITENARIIAIPGEGKTNVALRYNLPDNSDYLYTNIVTPIGNMVNSDAIEAFNYFPVWTRLRNGQIFGARPVNRNVCSTCYTTRILPSDAKIIGETRDSYLRLLANDLVDLPLGYGSINHMDVLSRSESQSIYVWQDYAFFRVPVGQYVQTIDSVGQLQLGSGRFFGQPVAINERSGTIHKWSVQRTQRSFYWYDTIGYRYQKFGQEGFRELSADKNMSSWFENKTGLISQLDSPLYRGGLATGWDEAYGEVMTTYLPPAQGLGFAVGAVLPSAITSFLVGGVDIITSNITAASLSEYAAKLTALGYGYWYNPTGTTSLVFDLPPAASAGTTYQSLTATISGSPVVLTGTLTAAGTPWTLAFNESSNSFDTFFTFTPRLYMNLVGQRLLSVDPQASASLYLHDVGPSFNVFYSDDEPAISSLSYCINQVDLDTKLPSNLILDSGDLWDTIEAIVVATKDASGQARKYRGIAAMFTHFRARAGKWLGPVPRATQMWFNGAWLSPNNSPAVRVQGEQVFIKLLTQSSDLRNILSSECYYALSKRNT